MHELNSLALWCARKSRIQPTWHHCWNWFIPFSGVVQICSINFYYLALESEFKSKLDKLSASGETWGPSQCKDVILPAIGIPMLKIRQSGICLIFYMEIPIPGKDGLYIETGPRIPTWVMFHPPTWQQTECPFTNWHTDIKNQIKPWT